MFVSQVSILFSNLDPVFIPKGLYPKAQGCVLATLGQVRIEMNPEGVLQYGA